MFENMLNGISDGLKNTDNFSYYSKELESLKSLILLLNGYCSLPPDVTCTDLLIRSINLTQPSFQNS